MPRCWAKDTRCAKKERDQQTRERGLKNGNKKNWYTFFSVVPVLEKRSREGEEECALISHGLNLLQFCYGRPETTQRIFIGKWRAAENGKRKKKTRGEAGGE